MFVEDDEAGDAAEAVEGDNGILWVAIRGGGRGRVEEAG